ncbi:hypothetical protein WOSG25_010100 [Weissella oryzae SG25]|uniref:AAA+ ATPase domain-containing protein n=1 Tax=Weissella oryzae (strain DSM 25784 / JCM 18191 / LMG 30913 / SG25) TaxID=1329250 RepID=A0A069CRW2_WEIOS|nr:AAA family ATPase [Weissella oryzae]GAK29923.1 hypothetical protein WOSG25_010100 [Weissella oryzae SG25]
MKNQVNEYIDTYKNALINSKNVIFHGAPGTGKTYLAKQVATSIISNGEFDDYTRLDKETQQQIEFVQFHPSYDYTDFVEGLRPKQDADGSMGFELRMGNFTNFVAKAQKNFDDAQKSKLELEKEVSVEDMIMQFFATLESDEIKLTIMTGREFYITKRDEQRIYVSIPGNTITDKLILSLNDLRAMLQAKQTFERVKDVTEFFGKLNATQGYSYILAIYKAIKEQTIQPDTSGIKRVALKPYVFIIDEINRGEVAKIFGELFFAIDPGYRGRAGAVATQYANLHEDPEKKFSIPANLYIIGTMNDIDRSVGVFDFAMHRRFRFIEIASDTRLAMLADLDEGKREQAIKKLTALNQVINGVAELGRNYQIGPAYFLNLKQLTFDQLWTGYLQPVLAEYVRGMYNEQAIMEQFANAYGYPELEQSDADENSEG